ncbi:type VI secretion system baseplate subunit TssF, partial [Escherichia coli]|uniref:type VI secretion system baseplate subunit TssF n=1 Tax=Escherichia coli TaxID=562 RepID=UPI0020790838
KTSIFSHPVYLFLREFSLQDFRGGSRPVDRLFTGIPVRGLASTLYLHPEPFVCEGEMYLLGTVLSHFLSLYASVNSFHMLTVVNTESQETWKWTERIGQHPLI